MNIFGYLIIFITIIMTVFIGIKKPSMHTRILIYDSQYTIVEEDKKTTPEINTKEKELPSVSVVNNLTKEERLFENKTFSNSEIKEENKDALTKTTPVKTKQEEKSKNTKQIEEIQKNNNKITPTIKEVNKIATQNIIETQNSKDNTNILTSQEEYIAWNIWRSNLQNQIIKDSKLPIVPLGTIFKMSFDVDENGRVTNVQTWSTDSKYTPYAIEFIAPVIRSYQGKSILEFPRGTARSKTKFEGGFKIAEKSKYSNPSDYNDIEKVIK